jgi:WD40 repeat protein
MLTPQRWRPRLQEIALLASITLLVSCGGYTNISIGTPTMPSAALLPSQSLLGTPSPEDTRARARSTVVRQTSTPARSTPSASVIRSSPTVRGRPISAMLLDHPAAISSRPPYPARLPYNQPISFSQNEALLAIGSSDGIVVYDIPTLQVRYRASTPNPVLSLAFSPDDKSLAIGIDSRQVLVWSLADQSRIRAIAVDGAPTALVYTADMAYLIVASPVVGVSLYNVSDGQMIRHLGIEQGGVGAIALTGDERAVMTVERGRPNAEFAPNVVVNVRQLTDGVVSQRFVLRPTEIVALAGTWGGAAYVRDGNVWLQRPSQSESPFIFAAEGTEDPVRALLFSASNRVLVGGTESGQLKFWAVGTGAVRQICAATPVVGPKHGIVAIALSSGSRWAATLAEDDQLRLWPVAPE